MKKNKEKIGGFAGIGKLEKTITDLSWVMAGKIVTKIPISEVSIKYIDHLEALIARNLDYMYWLGFKDRGEF